MDKKQEEVLSFVIRHAFKLGATLGSWLNTDFKFCNYAAHDAVDAMIPHFISEIKQRFTDIEQEESGYCHLCGMKKDKEDE